jgi:hypothetical protein
MRQNRGVTVPQLIRCRPWREEPLDLVAQHLEMALNERACSCRRPVSPVDRRRPESTPVTKISPYEHCPVTWWAYKQ